MTAAPEANGFFGSKGVSGAACRLVLSCLACHPACRPTLFSSWPDSLIWLPVHPLRCRHDPPGLLSAGAAHLAAPDAPAAPPGVASSLGAAEGPRQQRQCMGAVGCWGRGTAQRGGSQRDSSSSSSRGGGWVAGGCRRRWPAVAWQRAAAVRILQAWLGIPCKGHLDQLARCSSSCAAARQHRRQRHTRPLGGTSGHVGRQQQLWLALAAARPGAQLPAGHPQPAAAAGEVVCWGGGLQL